MATQKKKAPLIVSPPITVKYSHLVKPNTKFAKPEKNPDGTFELTGVLDMDNPKTAPFLANLEALAKGNQEAEAKESKKINKFKLSYGVTPETDKDGEETGRTLIKFTNGASFIYKNEKIFTKIAIVDSKKKPMVAPKVGNGSIVHVAFNAVPFCMHSNEKVGVSLRLSAVQVIKYVPFGGNDASSAFGEAEGFEDTDSNGFSDETSTGVNDTPAPEGGSGDGDY